MIEQKVEKAVDLEEVFEITKNLVNLPCWDSYIGYPSQLTLHFGEKEPYNHPRLKGKFRGSYRLLNQGNYFELFANEAIVNLSDKEDEEIENELRIIVNTTVIDVDISFPELNLTIHFSNGTSLKLYADDDEYNLAYWELYTPGDMVLKFGPHRTWSYSKVEGI